LRAWIGKSLVAIGIIHCIFGFVFLRSTLAVLWSEGLFNTVHGEPEREFVFWFLAFGSLAMILGAVIDWTERQGRFPPAFFGWWLFGLTVVVVTMMPASGGWLVFVPAIGAIIRSRRFSS
jgi:hypothetical protein